MGLLDVILMSTNLRPGLYGFFDYIGFVTNNTPFRITFNMFVMILNIVYIFAYVYAITHLLNTGEKKGFDHNLKLRFALIFISIMVLLTIFLLQH